jgi:hypothetical protein
MTQHDVIKRIESICEEFDYRAEHVDWKIARLELAKALAEEQEQSIQLRAENEQLKKDLKFGIKSVEGWNSFAVDQETELDKLRSANALLRKQLDEAMEKLDFYNKATATAFLERMKKGE